MSTAERTPLTRMRRAVTKSMTASAAIPQFTVESEADLAALEATRAELAPGGVSVTDALLAASARALVEHPGLNACFDEDSIVLYGERNVALAVALDDGLVAPAIRGADTLSLAALRDERKRLTAAARSGSLDPADLYAGTFTVSNLGSFGVRRFRALVTPRQAAILAVGGVSSQGLLSLSLSCDHRVLDGVPAARFLETLVELLAAPAWMGEL